MERFRISVLGVVILALAAAPALLAEENANPPKEEAPTPPVDPNKDEAKKKEEEKTKAEADAKKKKEESQKATETAARKKKEEEAKKKGEEKEAPANPVFKGRLDAVSRTMNYIVGERNLAASEIGMFRPAGTKKSKGRAPVARVQFLVTPETKILWDNNSATLAKLMAGGPLTVEYRVTPGGTCVALSINAESYKAIVIPTEGSHKVGAKRFGKN
ncbi:MAG: hypothetical protein V1809_02140 [Planctomycetota bacterium]